MAFEWDIKKSRKNLAKHGIDFETACRVFDDPYALTQHDALNEDDEERFVTLGAIGLGAIVLVVHTYRTKDGKELTRLISARAATSRERKAYEESHTRTEKADRRNRGKERR